jgi:hypothetical protein
MTCPLCLRPSATLEDAATRGRLGDDDPPPIPAHWGGDNGEALCWRAVLLDGGDCVPPAWWSGVTPLDVLRLLGGHAETRARVLRLVGVPVDRSEAAWAELAALDPDMARAVRALLRGGG